MHEQTDWVIIGMFYPWALARASRYGALMCVAFMAVLPLVAIMYWLLADPGTILGRYAERVEPGSFTSLQRMAGLAVTALPLATMGYVLWTLRTLLNEFAVFKVLSTQSAALVRRLAVGVSGYATALVPTQMALSLILTLNAPPGRKTIEIILTSESVILFGVAALLWLFALVMDLASEVARDNSLIV